MTDDGVTHVYEDRFGEVIDHADAGYLEIRWYDTTDEMSAPEFQDWLAAFAETHRREPTQDEIDSYILGEHTQRRIATYRRLAEELITRKTAVAEKQVPQAAADISEAPPRPVTAVKGNSLRSSLGREASNGADARSSSSKPVANGGRRRSGATTLIFWLLVLLVLVGLAWVYRNYPSLLHAFTG